MAIQDVLKGCPIFFELYEDEIEKIVKDQQVYHFKPEDPIIQEGQKGNEVYVLLEGSASIRKNIGDRGIKVERLKHGDVFGVVVLLDEKSYGIDVVAETNCYVLEIQYERIFNLYRKKPQLFSLISLNLSRILAQRLRTAQQAMAQLKKGRETDAQDPQRKAG